MFNNPNKGDGLPFVTTGNIAVLTFYMDPDGNMYVRFEENGEVNWVQSEMATLLQSYMQQGYYISHQSATPANDDGMFIHYTLYKYSPTYSITSQVEKSIDMMSNTYSRDLIYKRATNLEYADNIAKGVVTAEHVNTRDAPDGDIVGVLLKDQVVDIYEDATMMDGPYDHIWYRINDNEWVYSAWISRYEN